jgi:ABC-2 type transport system permease protein
MLAFVQTALIAMTGVIVPRDELPWGLRQAGELLPLTHGLESLRGAVAGDNLRAVSGDLALELAVGLVFAVLGLALYLAIERHSRHTNAYEYT